MCEQRLHIVSFDVPYPANYGGVIDVYYMLLALKNAGIKIHLHCFEYGRSQAPELEPLCEEIKYYPRKTGLGSNFSLKPYIVKSRRSDELILNLLKDEYPILFAGLHSCFYMDDDRLKNRIRIYREANIEHHYYYHLFKSEKNLLKKFFFIIESQKLHFFQKVLKHADILLAVSQTDTAYLQKYFPDKKVVFLPCFHSNEEFNIQPGKGDYVLYHGRLSVTENYNAAEFLVKKVFGNTKHKMIIAGMDPPDHLKKLIAKHENIKLIANPEDDEMFSLIMNAQANILITFQATGLKLKLLNTLYKGRFCIVNPAMVQGTGLESLCEVAEGADALKLKIEAVFSKEFNPDEITKRHRLLDKDFSNRNNGVKIAELIFPEK